MKEPEIQLSAGDKVKAAFASVFGLILCGPCIFLLMLLVLFLLASLPFLLFDAELPDWTIWPLAVLAALLTILLMVGAAMRNTQEEKRKATVKAAEFKRAQRELENE
ncbi:MAG: hypothetical protein OXE02_08045 [Chloroflexi bacterium]|nr:hypothetical protein [Chloroflexota bacterium]